MIFFGTTLFSEAISSKVLTKPVVFISYSHHDESWKDRLVKHLKVLQLEDIVKVWEDRRIGAGGNWYQEIQDAMKESKVAIMLVSVDFLTSEFRFFLIFSCPR